MMDATQRFSSRADNYVRYRPRYPQEVLDCLKKACGLTVSSLIADIGSGAGALSELFLGNGNRVFAVEPNREMREAAERLFGRYPGFQSREGRAEATTLSAESVDFAVVGQAFHWFDVPRTRCEFLRILKPSGWAMVVWNERDYQSTPFLVAYDRLLQRYAQDYARERHKRVYDTALGEFFGHSGFEEATFHYRQEMDFEGVRGRMLSSSYTPEPGHPSHGPLVAALRKIYEDNEVGGRVAFEYITRMYYGRLSG